jgi:DNA/RNA-binding domain of Phe-tRNA-synthetase-like protein
MRLIRATGEEPFEMVAGGGPVTEHPEPGEAVWCDAAGVICRRWNWRQGLRTRLTEESVNTMFLLERLEPTSPAELEAAGAELAELLEKLSPGAEIAVRSPQ